MPSPHVTGGQQTTQVARTHTHHRPFASNLLLSGRWWSRVVVAGSLPRAKRPRRGRRRAASRPVDFAGVVLPPRGAGRGERRGNFLARKVPRAEEAKRATKGRSRQGKTHKRRAENLSVTPRRCARSMARRAAFLRWRTVEKGGRANSRTGGGAVRALAVGAGRTASPASCV